MDWYQLIALIVSNVALFAWARAESRADFRTMLGIIDSIQKEITDFHGRLCALEEKNKGK